MMVIPYVSGFVLAGGRSRRMGCDKALLEVNGQPLLLRAVTLLKAHVGSVTVLGPQGRYESLGVPVLPDRWPRQGPLGALLTGLEISANGWSVFLACDLPLLNGQFIELLLRSTVAGKLMLSFLVLARAGIHFAQRTAGPAPRQSAAH